MALCNSKQYPINDDRYLRNKLNKRAARVFDAVGAIIQTGVVAHGQATKEHLQIAQWWDLVQHWLGYFSLEL